MQTIPQSVQNVLDRSTVDGMILRLPPEQLDRKQYEAVNKIIEMMGGKWNRKVKGHVFDFDPTDKLDQIQLTGEIDKPLKIKNGYWPTPKPLAKFLIDLVGIRSGMTVLEPSAGQGHILDHIDVTDTELFCIEILPENRNVLQKKGYQLIGEDFLKFEGKWFDRIVMNPPFERQQDIDHVVHAYSLLRDGGRLAAIMSTGVTFRINRKTVEFRDLVTKHGEIYNNPDGSFKDSGTAVNTVTVVINK